MYSAEDDNTEVLYFADATATFSSFAGAHKEILPASDYDRNVIIMGMKAFFCIVIHPNR